MQKDMLQPCAPCSWKMQEQYDAVARWMEPLRHIANILEPSMDKTSKTVEWEMQRLLDWVELTYTEEHDSVMVKNLLSYSRGFWKGLFTCYDHYHMPRTNNDLERFFRATKARHRRMTGLRSWNEYILRNGELAVLVDDALNQKHLIARFRMVDYSSYKKQKDTWNLRLSDSVARKRFRCDPLTYLKNLENQWENSNVS